MNSMAAAAAASSTPTGGDVSGSVGGVAVDGRTVDQQISDLDMVHQRFIKDNEWQINMCDYLNHNSPSSSLSSSLGQAAAAMAGASATSTGDGSFYQPHGIGYAMYQHYMPSSEVGGGVGPNTVFDGAPSSFSDLEFDDLFNAGAPLL